MIVFNAIPINETLINMTAIKIKITNMEMVRVAICMRKSCKHNYNHICRWLLWKLFTWEMLLVFGMFLI